VWPADGNETYADGEGRLRGPGPAYIRVGSGKERDVFPSGVGFELGKVRILAGLRAGRAIFAHGFILDRVLKAAEILASEGIRTRVVETATLKPADADGIAAALADCGAAVAVEDHTVIGALGSLVAEVAAERCPTHLVRLGVQDVFPESGPADALADAYGLSVDDIAAAARRAAYSRGVSEPLRGRPARRPQERSRL
jgi:transketolase